jgi:hypothetical protein
VISFTFFAEQQFSGFAYADYLATPAQFSRILRKAIAEILEDKVTVTIESVTEVSSVSTESVHTRFFRTASTNVTHVPLLVDYSMFMENAIQQGYGSEDNAYDDLSTKLKAASKDGTMTSEIHTVAKSEGALNFYNTTASPNITVSESMTPTVAPTHSPATINAIFFAVIGVAVVGFCFLCFTFYYLCKSYKQSQMYSLENSGAKGRNPKSFSAKLDFDSFQWGKTSAFSDIGVNPTTGYEMKTQNPMAKTGTGGADDFEATQLGRISERTNEAGSVPQDNFMPGGASYTLPNL